MDISALVGYVRDVMKNATAISTWCNTNYHTGHTIYIGYDENNPPEQDEYPVIVISPVEQDRSLAVDYGPMMIEIGYGIIDDTRTTAGNVITYTGLINIMAFRALVEGVLFGLNPVTSLGGAWIESAHEMIEPVEAYPVFVANVLYTFRNPDRFSTLLRQV
jgi:hypothetical protein